MKQPLIRFEENELFGYKNSNGNIVINPKFNDAPEEIIGNYIWLIERTQDDESIIYISDLSGNINLISNESLTEGCYYHTEIFEIDYLNDKYFIISGLGGNNDEEISGVIDVHGNVILNPIYNDVSLIFDHYFAMYRGEHYNEERGRTLYEVKGIASNEDDLFISGLNYSDYEPINNTIVLNLHKSDWYEILNYKGDVLIKFDKYEKCENDIYLIVSSNNKKYGLFNTESCELIIPMEYDDIRDVSENYLIISKRTKAGVWNLTKKCFDLPIEFDEVTNIKEGSLIVSKNSKYGIWSFIEKQYLLPLEYENISEIKPEQDNPPEEPEFTFTDIEENTNYDLDFVLVSNHNKYGIWDVTNKRLCLPIEYDKIKYYDDDLSEIIKQGRKGLYYNTTNNIILECEFDNITDSCYYTTDKLYLFIKAENKDKILFIYGNKLNIKFEFDVFIQEENGKEYSDYFFIGLQKEIKYKLFILNDEVCIQEIKY